MTHAAIAVALMGAAFTLGLAIWESQRGKTQAPAKQALPCRGIYHRAWLRVADAARCHPS